MNINNRWQARTVASIIFCLTSACATTTPASHADATRPKADDRVVHAVALGAMGAVAGGVGGGASLIVGIQAYAAATKCDERGLECEPLGYLLFGGFLPAVLAGSVLGASTGVLLALTLPE